MFAECRASAPTCTIAYYCRHVRITGKLIAALAWLAPSVVAALAGAPVAGIVEVRGDLDRAWIATAAIAPIALPVLLIAALVARGLYAAWVPESLAAELREERGSMPRLAAWVGVVWLGLLGLAWAMFQGTWLLASWTAFKVNAISFLAAILAVLALIVLLALSRPAAELFTIIARGIERGWQRHLPGSLLRPPVIFLGALITACLAGYLSWILLVTRRLPELSPGFLLGSVAGVLATAIVHAAWRGPWIARAIGGGVVIVVTLVVILHGLRALRHEPRTAIAIWSESRLGKLGIESLTDIEDLRDQLPLDGPRLIDRGGFHRDLVLITIDGIRADRTPGHGGPAPMAALEDLSRRGLVFDWAFAPSPTERRSIPSLVTGISPPRVRGQSSEHGFELDPRHVSIGEKLRAAGYETAAFTCCFGRAERTWMRGFDLRVANDNPVTLAELARDWVKARTGTQPLLLWIHVAVPWPADREALTSERRLAVYDEGLRIIDRAITQTIGGFAARTVETAPIVVVAGTRGEELGEHGTPFDQDELFNTQLRVPLVIAGPTVRVGHQIDAVSLVDLGPTLIELAGYAPARGMVSDGISLAPVIRGTRSSLGTFAFAAVFPERGLVSRATVIRGGHKLIDGPTLELYDLKADPDERANIASSRVQVVAELRALLNARARAAQISPF